MLNRIPDAEDSKDDREVGLHGCSSEVVVHPVSSRQQLNKVVKSDVQGNCHPDGWPQAVPSSNPVPELEHICLVNAELGDQRLVCASRDEGQNDPHGQTNSKNLVQKMPLKYPYLRATKCLATKLGFLAERRNQVLQVSALVIVSWLKILKLVSTRISQYLRGEGLRSDDK